MKLKRDKIGAIKKLVTGLPEDQVLTPEEIQFLKARPGVNYEAWINSLSPLIIFVSDNEEAVDMIYRIAEKMGRKVIRLRRAVINFKEGYERPQHPVFVQAEQVIRRIDSAMENIPEAEVIQPEALPEHCQGEESEGIKNGVYKLSFPSVYAGLDDDEDDSSMMIKNRYAL